MVKMYSSCFMRLGAGTVSVLSQITKMLLMRATDKHFAALDCTSEQGKCYIMLIILMRKPSLIYMRGPTAVRMRSRPSGLCGELYKGL